MIGRHQHNLGCIEKGPSGLYCKVTAKDISTSYAKGLGETEKRKERWANQIWTVKAGNAKITALPAEHYRAPTAISNEPQGNVEIVVEFGPFHYKTLGKITAMGKHWQLRDMLGLSHYNSAQSAFDKLKKPVSQMSKGWQYTFLPDDSA